MNENLHILIRLNGKPYRVAGDHTLQHLVDKLGYQNKRIAVELNQKIVARSLYPDTTLNPDDNIEIVQAIGGG